MPLRQPFRPGPGTDRILVIQLGDIGDVVLTSPSLRALKEALPGARVTALVRKGYGSLLAADPHVSGIVEAARGKGRLSELGRESAALVRRLRQARFDLVIDLRTGDRGALLAWLTGAPVRVVRRDRDAPFWHRLAFTHPVDLVLGERPAHPGGDQSLRILRAIGIDTDDTRPRLYVPDESLAAVRALLSRDGGGRHPRLVTVNPFSRWKYKEWGHDGWVDLLDWLWTARGLPAAVIGSREEAGAAGAIAARCAAPVINLAGKTSLGELAALLSLSCLHVGVDSAAPHIAAAVGTPTVTIFGPTDWRAWTVPDETHRIVTPDDPCVPCHRKGCDDTERSLCLENLGPEKVKAAVDAVLEAGRAC